MNRKTVSIAAFCLGLVFSLAVCAASAKHDTLIVSGKDNYWQTVAVTTGSGGTTVTVNENQKNQKWLGFGGCFNEKGWEALSKLSAADKDRAMRLLFDKSNGLGLTWGRIPIGASDYALSRYTLDETKDDTGMTSFSIDRDKQNLLPFVKAAKLVKPDILFWASAWTPPTWMKTGATDAAGYDGGVMRNEPKYLKANALYTAKFIEAYKAEGITIKAVFPQNEPGYTQNYPSCGWGKYRKPDGTEVNGTEYLSDYTANYLIPTIQQRAAGTDVWFGTLSNGTYALAYWDAARTKAGQNIKGVGLQWNNVNIVGTVAGQGYVVMQSEHQCGNYPWNSAKATGPDDANASNFLAAYAPNNHAYGEESWTLIADWLTRGANIYSAWNMVLDTGGFNLDQSRKWPQNALLAVNYQSSTLKVTPTYYVFRHLAQFIDTGAVRLGTQGGANLAVLSFRNPDSSIVTVLYNSSTSGQSQMTVAVSGKTYKVNVPARGWATLCVGLKSAATSINEIVYNQFHGDGNGLTVTCKGEGYRIGLPSRQSGRVELLTVTGQILQSKAIPQGSREILLPKQASHAGLLLVRAEYGGQIKTARFFTAR